MTSTTHNPTGPSATSAAARPAAEAALVRAEGISKRFGITQALDDVSVAFHGGRVHALMGENGAGKSTLGKTIAGLIRPDTGAVRVDGRELKLGSIDEAFAAGVRIVHQELAQCPNLSVAENLCLHDMPRGRIGIDRHEMARRAASLVHRIDPGIEVEAPLGALAPGRRQICQIAASLDDRSATGGSAPRMIVFDEPTSSLSVAEADTLMEVVRQLAEDGLAIVYVSHRMGEIFACCDEVTVLRDGKFVATNTVADIDEATLVEQMIGRRIVTPKTGEHRTPGGEAAALRSLANGHADHDAPSQSTAPLLRVRSLSSPGKLRDVSLEVRPGEVLGVGGLVGAGRSELLDAIFGLDPRATGDIDIASNRAPGRDCRWMIKNGVGYVPEDRRLQGLFFQLGVGENIVVPFMPRLASLAWRALGAERSLVADRIGEFQIKTASTASTPGELSGGNQQKLLIARWMGKDTRVLLLDEPTRGIDVGTKAEIYKSIRAASAAGAAVLLVSSEMPELLALSDRIVVMAEGQVGGTLEGDDMTQRNILNLATHESESVSQPVATAS